MNYIDKIAAEVYWEQVQDSLDRTTTRLKVPSGWLYCLVEKGDMGGILNQMLVFVPACD